MGVITDLHDPLTEWAKTNLSLADEQLESGEMKLDIDTSKLRLHTTEVKFTDRIPTGNGSPSGVVFKSRYVNKTDTPQEHTFIMERTTEATVTTSLAKGFTRNGTVGIKLDVPEQVSNLTGGFGSDVTIETDDVNTIKHSLTWSINSKVIAPRQKTTIAQLSITEKRSSFGFTADVTLKGRVLGMVTEASTGKVKYIQGDLANILSKKQISGARTDIETRKVTWKVEGSLHFRFGVSQDVEVDYE